MNSLWTVPANGWNRADELIWLIDLNVLALTTVSVLDLQPSAPSPTHHCPV